MVYITGDIHGAPHRIVNFAKDIRISRNPLTVWHGNRLIGIDCGSGFPINENAYLEKGRLACLRLDDMKEFYSDSIAQESLR